MKKVTPIAILLIALLSISIIVSAQSSKVADINSSFSGSSYTSLEQIMADNINANILGKQYSSRSSASQTLRQLFANKNLSEYQLLHSGNNGNSTFMVATVKIDGTKYRMNILLKNDKITEIRIEQEL